MNRTLNTDKIDKIIKNRFAKLTEAQQTTLYKYLLSPLALNYFKNWLTSNKSEVIIVTM
jgi:hypothetical protein